MWVTALQYTFCPLPRRGPVSLRMRGRRATNAEMAIKPCLVCKAQQPEAYQMRQSTRDLRLTFQDAEEQEENRNHSHASLEIRATPRVCSQI